MNISPVAQPAGAGEAAFAPASQPASRSGERLGSLDVFRGFTMLWLLGGKAFALALAALVGADWVRYQLNHSEWEGLRYYDLVWPSFMLMVGVSVPFSFAKRSLTQSRAEIMRHVVVRAVALFLLGSLRESLSTGKPMLIELSSALQPIAVAYVVASLFAGRARWLQLGVTAAILVGYALLLALVPPAGAAAGTYEMNHNLVTAIDQQVLGRSHRDGWGTVLSLVPTIANTMIGLLLGQVLLSPRPATTKLKVILMTGVGCLAAGFALSPVIPIIMKLWTTSYALASAGWACLLFAVFFWLVDVRQWRAWTFPLVVIGMNALAAYLLPTVVPIRSTLGVFTKPLASHLGSFGPVLASGAVLLAGWLILFWLYRRKIFFRG